MEHRDYTRISRLCQNAGNTVDVEHGENTSQWHKATLDLLDYTPARCVLVIIEKAPNKDWCIKVVSSHFDV